ncbi:MAG: hypothetical protein IJZ89_09325 [Clostridia bacterium]|nr:hypothetical protein [Clostridia bacterium]
MGRLLGAHDSDDLDRPDLNKCPDCGCFFAQNNCPLCGKECPEEMRAGNRKKVKIRKRRRRNSSRVTFVDWYHSWWFIILMMFFFPLAGIILLATSPHKRSSKIIFIIIAVIYGIISTIGIGNIIGSIADMLDNPVDTSLSKEVYMAKCEEVSAEEYYRQIGKYKDEFIKMTLVVEDKIVGSEDLYGAELNNYYLCHIYDERGDSYSILIRDCLAESMNFLRGDRITVYGEGAGNVTVYDINGMGHNASCINAAYIE